MVYGGEFETGSGGINVESEMIGLCVDFVLFLLF